MSKRRKSSPPIDRMVRPLPAARGRWLLYAAALAVLAGILAFAYLRPLDDEPSPGTAASSLPLELPTEPEALTVEQLRAEGEQAVSELLARYPESPAAHQGAAMLYQTLNQYDRVIAHWKKCIALDPSNVVPHEWLAKAQSKTGKDNEAALTLAAALEAGLRSAPIYHEHAIVLQRTGKLSEAERVARQGLELYSEDFDLWIALGQAQFQLDKLEDARASFASALRIKPQSAAAHFSAANVCLRLQDDKAAAEHRRQVERLHEEARRDEVPYEVAHEQALRLSVASVLSLAATLYDEQGQSAKAEQLCQRAYSVHPGYPDSYRQLANMYHRDGKIPSAIVVQQRLTVVEPDNDANHLNLASLHFKVGQMAAGEAALLAAARAAPQKAIFPQTLAEVGLRSGQLVKARHAAEQAIRLEPTRERFRLLAEICRKQGDASAETAAAQAAQRLASGGKP